MKQRACIDCGDAITFMRSSARCRPCRKMYEYAVRTVSNHYRSIFLTSDSVTPTYKGMIFEDAWNPAKGGSFNVGALWIMKNLGQRPENRSLHVMRQEVGFVPGNLEWADAKKQVAEQMHRILRDLRRQIAEKDIKIKVLESALYKVNLRHCLGKI